MQHCRTLKKVTSSYGAAMLLCLVGLPSLDIANAGDGSGMQTSVAVDIAAQTATDKDTAKDGGTSDRLSVREAEFILYGPIDHTFDGVLSVAAHEEGGVALFEVHEAIISSTKLIPRSRFRLGQFFLGIGRLNQFHRHDWPFISAPYVHTLVFNDQEGALDTGLEFSTLLPLPFFLDVTLGATNGFNYGHSHSEGEKPRKPTHYTHLKSFFQVGGMGLQPGLSYLTRTDASDTKMTLTGWNLTAKQREGKTLRILVEHEAWQRTVVAPGADDDKILGGYLYFQYGLSPSFLIGVREDYYTSTSLTDVSGNRLKNSRVAHVPTLTYRSSEFAVFRVAWTHDTESIEGADDQVKQYAEVQAMFIMGAHPAHDF